MTENESADELDAIETKRNMRIELIRKLMLRGYKTVPEIQEALAKMKPPIELSDRTVYRYRGILVKRTAKLISEREGLNKSIEELAFELKQIIEEVSRELWKQYHAPSTVSTKCPKCGEEHPVKLTIPSATKVSALKEIRETAKGWVDLMQNLGLVARAPLTHQHQMLDKEGKPVDVDKVQLNQQFIAFIKATYQDPLGPAKAANGTNKP